MLSTNILDDLAMAIHLHDMNSGFKFQAGLQSILSGNR